MFLNLNSEKIKLFVATGLQGFYRVITLFIIELFYGLSEVGKIGIHLSVSQIISFFTVIGFCTLILSRVSGISDDLKKFQVFNELLINIIINLIIILIIFNTLNFFINISYHLEISAWLFSWTFYITSRHYFLADKNYNSIIKTDLLLISLSVFAIWLNYFNNISIVLSFIMFLVSVINFLIIGNFKYFKLKKIIIEPKGFEFGLANFVSSSLLLSLMPLSSLFLSLTYTGILALFINCANIIMLVPRSISIYLIPLFSKVKSQTKEVNNLLSNLMGKILIVTILILGVFIFFSKMILIFYSIDSQKLFYIFIFISLYLSTNNFSILYSIVLVVYEQSKASLIITIITSLVYLFFIIFSYLNGTNNSFLIISIGLFVAGLIRLILLKKFMDKNYA